MVLWHDQLEEVVDLSRTEKDKLKALLSNPKLPEIPSSFFAHPASAAGLLRYLLPTTEESTDVNKYLESEYGPEYEKARKNLPYGRAPKHPRDRNEPLKADIDLGQQLPVTGREDSQLAALWFLAKIFHSYYRNVPTEVPFEKSLAMMSLIGMPGSGKTMFLRSLPSLLHELLETQWDTCKAYVLRAIDKPGAEDEAQHFLEVLQRSVDPMHQMVIWLRLNLHPKIHPLEHSVAQALALRYLYGCLTWLDSMSPDSPLGGYEHFLSRMDPDVRSCLEPSHVFEFLKRQTGIDSEAQRIILVLADETNACSGSFDNQEHLHWGQQLAAQHVQVLITQPENQRACLPVLIMATTTVTDADMTYTSRAKARTGVISLPAIQAISVSP